MHAANKRNRICVAFVLCGLYHQLSANSPELEQKRVLFAEAQTKYDEAMTLSKELAEKAVAKRKEANDVAAATSLAGPTPDKRASYQTELTEVQTQLETAQEDNTTAEEQLASLKKQHDEEKQQSRKDSLQRQIDAAEQKITEITEKIDELQAKADELNSLIDTPSPIERTVNLTEEAIQAEKAAKDAAAQLDPLKAQLDAAQKELQAAEAKNEQEQKEINESAEILKKAEERALAAEDVEQQPVDAVQTPVEQAPPVQTTAPNPSENPAQPVPEKTIAPAEPVKQLKPTPSATPPKPTEKIISTVPEEGEGIDTLDEEGGNWLLKRRYLEETIDEIEEINTLFSKILESRMDYLLKRNNVDHEFDIFAHDMGFKIGDLDQLITTILEDIEKYRLSEGDLNQEEREFVAQVEEKQTYLKSASEKMKAITELSNTIDMVIIQAEEEVNKSHNYQMQAWKNFQMIKRILNDEKAAELYKQTEGLYKNMQAIDAYLTGDLHNYFESTVQTLRDSMNAMKSDLQELAAKGVALEKELDALEAQAAQLKQAREQGALPTETPQEEITEVTHNEGFFNTLMAYVYTAGAYIGSIWHYLLSFFTGPQEEPLALAERVAAPQRKDVVAQEKEVTIP